jgi:hypothetical protein
MPLPHEQNDALHVSVRQPSRPPRRAGVVGHLVTDPLVSVVIRAGLEVADPASVFCQLSGTLTLPDLVAVGDALVLRPVYTEPWDERPWVSVRDLDERIEMYRGRGKTAARKAAELIRPGAESRPETLLRLALIAAGLPEPEVNVNIVDRSGRFLGRGDLVYRQWRVIVEYDGDHHRTETRQFDRDIRRLDDLAADGWRVVRVVGRSFFTDRQACLTRVARALTDAGWGP